MVPTFFNGKTRNFFVKLVRVKNLIHGFSFEKKVSLDFSVYLNITLLHDLFLSIPHFGKYLVFVIYKISELNYLVKNQVPKTQVSCFESGEMGLI